MDEDEDEFNLDEFNLPEGVVSVGAGGRPISERLGVESPLPPIVSFIVRSILRIEEPGQDSD